MKKFTAILLTLIMTGCFLLSGCQSDNDKVTTPTGSFATASTQPTGGVGSSPLPATAEATATIEPTATPTPTERPDYSGGIISEEGIEVPFNSEVDLSILKAQCGTGLEIALQFCATAPFYGIGFHSPTWTKTDGYSVDYFIYEWKEDYFNTVWGDPVVEVSTEGWKDGACAKVVFEDGVELPAGEYVLLAYYRSAKALHNSGVYYLEKDFEYTRAYLDEEIWEGVSIVTTVFYSKTPANLYGPISDSGIE